MLTTNEAEYPTKPHLRKSRCLNVNETVRSAANLSLSVLHTESSLNLGGQELRILTQMEWLLEHRIDTWLFARETSAIYSQAKSRGLPLMAANFRASCNPILTHRILRFVQERRNSVIDCHSSRDASVVAPLRILGWPVVRTQHICKTLKSGVIHRHGD